MHIQIISRQNCEANNQPMSTYVQSLLFYQKWESWPLEKEKKSPFCIQLYSYITILYFFACSVKNSHNKQCCDIKKIKKKGHVYWQPFGSWLPLTVRGGKKQNTQRTTALAPDSCRERPSFIACLPRSWERSEQRVHLHSRTE